MYEAFPKNKLNATKIMSIEEIFNSKKLYINESIITSEYIKLFKRFNSQDEPLNKPEELKTTLINDNILKKKDKIKWEDFYYLCKKVKLIESLNNK